MNADGVFNRLIYMKKKETRLVWVESRTAGGREGGGCRGFQLAA